MEEVSIGTRQAFVRQRRNLIGVSIALALFSSAGIRINTLNLFGNQLEIANPGIVVYLLWCVWCYLLLRYYQYLRVLGGNEFRGYYFDSMRRSLGKKALKEYVSEESAQGKLARKVRLDDVKVYQSHPQLWEVGIDVSVRSKTQEGERGGEKIEDVRKSFSGPALWAPRINAFLSILFRTPQGTEYWLPYFIAGTPLIIAVAKVGGYLI
jgi:hypothetical protein